MFCETRIYFCQFFRTKEPENWTFFGGEAMKWLEEVTFITATRHSRQRKVTVKIENIRLLSP
jgi:acyl-CoA hydrolase